jgi:hypothetical protein
MATVGQLVLVREGDAIHPAWVMKVIAGREVVVKYAGWSAAYSETKKFTDIVVPPNARRKTAAASMVEAIEAKKKIMPEGLGTEGIEVTHVRLVDRAGVLSVGEVCDIAYDFPAAVLENAGTDVASSLRCQLDLKKVGRWEHVRRQRAPAYVEDEGDREWLEFRQGAQTETGLKLYTAKPCKYGAGCTRENPLHFQQETHPDGCCKPESLVENWIWHDGLLQQDQAAHVSAAAPARLAPPAAVSGVAVAPAACAAAAPHAQAAKPRKRKAASPPAPPAVKKSGASASGCTPIPSPRAAGLASLSDEEDGPVKKDRDESNWVGGSGATSSPAGRSSELFGRAATIRQEIDEEMQSDDVPQWLQVKMMKT